MADGSIIIDTHIDNKEAQKELASLKKSMQKLSGSLEAKKGQQSAIAQEMQQADAAIEETHQNIKRLEAELKALQGLDLKNVSSGEYLGAQLRIPEVQAELERQRAALEQQGQAADKVAARYDKVSSEVSQITAELEKATDRAGYLAQQVTGMGNGGQRAATDMAKAAKQTQRFKRRIVELTKSALLFSVLTKALTVMRNWLGKTIAASDEATAAISSFKGALQGLAAPILSTLIPVLVRLINFFTQLVSLLGRGISALFGMTNKQAVETAKNLNAEQEALEGVGGAASDAEKQLASFDEINKLSEAGGGGGGGLEPGAADFSEIELPPWMAEAAERLASAFGKLRDSWNGFKDNPNVQKIWNFVKRLEKMAAAYTVEGLANGIELLADALSILDDVLEGDFKGAWGKIKELFSDPGNFKGLSMNPMGWATDLGVWLGQNLRESVLEWWDRDVVPYFSEKKWKTQLENVKKAFTEKMSEIFEWWRGTAINKWWQNDVKPWFTKDKWKQLFQEAKTGVSDGWSEFKTWWNSTISDWWNNNVAVWFTREKWSSVMGGIKDAFSSAFRDAANAAIGVLNRMIAWINDRLKFNIPQMKWTNPFTGNVDTLWEAKEITIATIPDIPYLAQGAVIPPNREFMAVLGDQKSGTNIETPLSTMVQAFKQALNERGGGSRTIVLEVDRRELGRVTFDVYNEEADRVGLVLGGA